jgi:hypothetical protein
MTRSEAITALYALFNAPHNADINLAGLNVLLDDLCKSHTEQNEYLSKAYRLANELRCHLAIAPAPQRQWVGLTDEEIKTICLENGWDSSWQSMRFAHAIEAKLKERNI